MKVSLKQSLMMAALAATVSSASLAAAPSAAPQPAYKPVTDARLANPEPENWLLTKGNYEGWSYSPLNQVTTANVSKLKPVWSSSTGVLSGH